MAQHIKTLLHSLVNPQNSWKHTLLQNWRNIFGNLSTKVTLEKIYNNTIVLGVYDSCWMHELYLLSPLLLNKINENLDQDRIKQVRFKQTGRKKRKKNLYPQKPTKSRKEFFLSPTEKSALTKVNDLQLRNALKEFRIRCYREFK